MMSGHEDGMLFGGVFMWLFWILLIVIIVLLVRFLVSANDTSTLARPEKDPLTMLKERYARGEIDDDEYEHRKKELES